MTTRVLLFHPDYARSKANRALADAAAAVAGVEIVDMYGRYPTGSIDVDHEVAGLLAAERLVLQFPVQWYSTPPLLKAWQDEVLSPMYYVHAKEQGDRMRGAPVMVAATAGNTRQAYGAEGVNLSAGGASEAAPVHRAPLLLELDAAVRHPRSKQVRRRGAEGRGSGLRAPSRGVGRLAQPCGRGLRSAVRAPGLCTRGRFALGARLRPFAGGASRGLGRGGKKSVGGPPTPAPRLHRRRTPAGRVP